MTGDIDYESLEEALNLVAAWLLAAYGPRLERVSLGLEGHYGPLNECFGIIPIVIVRGFRSDGTPETRQTMPTSEICGHAESLFSRFFPMVHFTRDSSDDVRHVASSRSMFAADVSAHRRLELLREFGRIGLSPPDRKRR